jgi:hypothetical protein
MQAGKIAAAAILPAISPPLGVASAALGLHTIYKGVQALRTPADAKTELNQAQLDRMSYKLAERMGQGSKWEAMRDVIQKEWAKGKPKGDKTLPNEQQVVNILKGLRTGQKAAT